jgi:predicted esterase
MSNKKSVDNNEVITNAPYNKLDSLQETFVLMQNNTDDPIVDINSARKTAEKLKSVFEKSGEKYKYIEHNSMGHSISPEMFNEVVNWLKTIFKKV